MSIGVWKIKGHRDIGAGATVDMDAIAFGATEEKAWHFFDKHQQPAFSMGNARRNWARHEVILTPVIQEAVK